MKIAVCSLSHFAYITEFIDAAQRLATDHQVRYFLGFGMQNALRLLNARQVPYQVLLDERTGGPSSLTVPAAATSVHDLFQNFFFKQAALVLPRLLHALEAWEPDLLLAYLRDYAGMTAAEVLRVPMVSFGSLPSPVRVEGIDPPFGAGVSKDSPERVLHLAWKLHAAFNSRLDPLFNATLRGPYGLAGIQGASTLHSRRLVLLGELAALSNKNTAEPTYVHFLGPLFKGTGALDSEEQNALARIAASPRPRVFVSLGTTYAEPLVGKCLEALAAFPGTVIATIGNTPVHGLGSLLERERVVCRPFFAGFADVVELADAVVTVTAAKTVLAALAAGKPLVCLPQQGEHMERAHRLQALGAGEIPCPRSWDSDTFGRVTKQVATEPRYSRAAGTLQACVQASGGIDEAVKLVNEVLSLVKPASGY